MGNDLVAKFFCKCPSEDYKDHPTLAGLIKTQIKLWGYNDNYFFREVNKESRELVCKCGIKYSYQWTYAGVIMEEIL